MAKVRKRDWRCRARPPRVDCRETSWRLVLTAPDGTRVVRATKIEDEGEARRLAAEVERSYRETGGPPGADVSRTWTVGDVVRQATDWRRRQGPEVPGCSLAMIELVERGSALLADTLMRVPAAELERKHVVRAQDELRDGKRGAKRINTILSVVAASWSWALDRGLVRQPWPRVRRLKETKTRKRPMTEEEVERVLAWIASGTYRRWSPVFLGLLDTGARISELLRARERDLDRATGRLTVYSTKTRTYREVFLSPETVTQTPVRSPDLWLYPSPQGPDRPALKGTVGTVMARACQALGVADVDLHSFRRTWVTRAVRTPGVVPEVAMKLSGHTSPAIFRSYQRLAQDDLAAVAAAIHRPRGLHHEHHPIRGERPGEACSVSTSVRKGLDDDSGVGRPRSAEQRNRGGEAREAKDFAAYRAMPEFHETFVDVHERARQGDADQLARLAGLGFEVRSALRALASDPDLARTFLTALGDAWPDEGGELGSEHRADSARA